MSHHDGEIVRSGDLVVIFGAESHGGYAEGFDARSGRPIFRFCSCYWFDFSEAWKLSWDAKKTSKA